MSHINVYTAEDVLFLNSMINLLEYNVNHHTCFDVNTIDVSTIDSIGIWRLCSKEEIINKSIASTIYKFICFLEPSPCFIYTSLSALIYKESLENVPLYINKPDNLRLIAHWRLQIGK